MPPGNGAGLAPYTNLDGHRRVAALEANGSKHVNAVLRHDLADADESAVEAIFLQFNLNRRHLHQIDKVRIALRQYQIEKGRPRGEVRPWDESEARDRVGKAIGMSGRNLCHYFRLLLTPLEVQNSVKDGKLALVLGEKVSWLAKQQQAEIAERIRGGENPKDVVCAYVASRNGQHKEATAAFRVLVKHLGADVADLEGRTDKIHRDEIREALPLFDRVAQLLRSLRREAKKPTTETSVIAELAKVRGVVMHNGADYFGEET